MTDMTIEFMFEIDLNMLEGDEVVSHLDNLLPNLRRNEVPEPGQTVYALDEDGARYLAVVERIDAQGFAHLCLKRESRIRPQRFDMTEPPPAPAPAVAAFDGQLTRPAVVTPALTAR